MKLILVRHGHTGESANKIVQGQFQNKLTKTGREQANLVGERLKSQKIDVIYCSDLRRTKETLLPIIKHHPHTEVIYEPLLREKTSGIFDGKPLHLREEARIKSGLSKEEFRPEGGENYADLLERIHKFIDMLIQNYSNETILAVTHWRWISNFLFDIDHSLEEKITKVDDIANTSINVIEIDPLGKHKIELINSIEHLRDLPLTDLSD